MARAPTETVVRLRFEGLEDLQTIQAEGWKLVERRIAQLIASEIERRVAEERASLLRLLGYLAATSGTAELRIPDRVYLQDPPEVTVWRDRETDETVYRFRRREPQ